MNSFSKPLLWLALALLGGASAGAPVVTPPVLEASPQQVQAAAIAAELLTRFHYTPMPLDDALSAKIFERYLKALDPDKLFFLQSDIDRFAPARGQLDDAIKGRSLTLPFAMFRLHQQRLRQRLTDARALLGQGFDFQQHEHYTYRREHAAWAASETELRDVWRRRVKNDWLRLKLAGQGDLAIRTTLEKRYDYALANLAKQKSEDAFQVFMNAYATAIEPHTNYLGPKATEDFDIAMKLSLVGIGAVLQTRQDMTVIRELVPGGPAAQSGLLKVGDRIVAVAQAQDSAPTDVLGWRLDDVVRMIRGTQDTAVTLSLLPAEANPDAPQKVVTLVRKKITLEQQAAKKTVVEVKQDARTQRIGVITLPTFYQDFAARQKGDPTFKSASRDVARLLSELKRERIDSVLIDLRNNGGGSLSEAVELSSLFIGSAPVVQQRDARANIRVEGSNQASAAWDGQLGVLINRASASASEIFAAAMQDYGRAVIIGERSFGKGTVQSVINLNTVARRESPKLGEVKMTIAQFFRINGGTTQLRGVTPDIELPGFADADSGESGFDNALPWVQISAATYQPLGDLSAIVPLLQKKHRQRIAADPEFRFLQEDIDEFAQQRSKGSTSLNERERHLERAARQARLKQRAAVRQADPAASASKVDLQDDGLQANERTLSAELLAEKAAKEARDLFQIEAANILADQSALIDASARLAQQVQAGFSRLKAPPGALAR